MPKNDSHDFLVKHAIDAINTVFSDRTVDQSRTKASMLRIMEEAQTNIDSLGDVAEDDREL